MRSLLPATLLVWTGAVAGAFPQTGWAGEHVLSLDREAVRQRIADIKAARPKEYKMTVAERTEQQHPPGSVVMIAEQSDKADHDSGSNEHDLVQLMHSTAISSGPPGKGDNSTKFTAAPAHNPRRCGLSWDHAAVYCGGSCTYQCAGGKLNCYTDLPDCDGTYPAGQCVGVSRGVSDAWCVTASKTIDGPFSYSQSFYDHCVCEDVPIGRDTKVEGHRATENASLLPERGQELVKAIINRAATYDGLPSCTWAPHTSCSNTSQYECLAGRKKGECSGDNWYYRETECTASCVHTALLSPAPYYAVWRSGPRALPFHKGQKLPHYVSKEAADTKSYTRPFEHPARVLMSTYCRSSQIAFVGVSLFSPKYEVKAQRLLKSCNKLGVCCKATEMRSDVFGPSAPEGSEAFRYKTIAIKPIFLLSQIEKTAEPVVYLDVDLEFHQFPKLFLPGSWPEGPRDVALFNFWANETNVTLRRTPNIGSAVCFFNRTYRAKKLLTAWAEAMQYGTNQRAPDDQVLDTLLVQGGWLRHVSLGWLPVSYLRTMPSYYRGVDPVIDHDRGTQPGVSGHSSTKPLLPKVIWQEPVDKKEILDIELPEAKALPQ
jgi:hypothetical protein